MFVQKGMSWYDFMNRASFKTAWRFTSFTFYYKHRDNNGISIPLAIIVNHPKFLPLLSVSLSHFAAFLVFSQTSVNYCSHSSRGVKWGQLRVPGWVWQSGTLERHSGDWGARETESWNCRGRDARSMFASRIPGSPVPVTKTGARGSNAVMSAS